MHAPSDLCRGKSSQCLLRIFAGNDVNTNSIRTHLKFRLPFVRKRLGMSECLKRALRLGLGAMLQDLWVTFSKEVLTMMTKPQIYRCSGGKYWTHGEILPLRRQCF